MKPTTEQELAEIVASATAPLEIIGGGSRAGYGNPVIGASLYVAGLSGITLYDPGALTLVAKAGTLVSEIETALAAEGQMLPFEPMDHGAMLGNSGTATLGGMVAVNASGPRRIKTGACRDSLIGVRYVDGMGQIIKNGGRVMKNVTGYDLVKLMAGAHGTLGVMTEVAFKLLPKPETSATLRFELGLEAGLAKLREAMASPYDVSAAAYLDGAALLRVEGFEESVKYRANQLGGDIVEDPWTQIRDVPMLAGAANIWRLSVKPSDACSVANTLHAQGFETPVFDWSGGLIWVTSAVFSAAPRAISQAHAQCFRGAFSTFPDEPAPIAKLSSGLRQKFDPRGILNQGRMG